MRKALIFLFCTALIYSCFGHDLKKELRKKSEYKGVITKIYRDDKFRHGMYVFSVRIGEEDFEEACDWYPRSWEYAKVGDSIIKPADTLMFIIKKNDSTYMEFFYKSRSLKSN